MSVEKAANHIAQFLSPATAKSWAERSKAGADEGDGPDNNAHPFGANDRERAASFRSLTLAHHHTFGASKDESYQGAKERHALLVSMADPKNGEKKG